MKIIPPIVVSDANLIYSNVPENDAPLWSAAGNYGIGNRVIDGHSVFEALTANAGKQPAASPNDWLRIGATNRYRAFDRMISAPAIYPGQVVYTIRPGGAPATSLALFGLLGSTVEVEVSDPNDGLVYSRSFSLIDDIGVIDWLEYFFSDAGTRRTEILIDDLPQYGTADITIKILNPGGNARVGQVVLGRPQIIGTALIGTSLSIEDYSRKERDDFGNPIIVQRSFSQVVDFDIAINTRDARRVQNMLAKYRTSPVVWVGSRDESFGTIVYGYYRRFDIVLSGPTVSDAAIEVEGLI